MTPGLLFAAIVPLTAIAFGTPMVAVLPPLAAWGIPTLFAAWVLRTFDYPAIRGFSLLVIAYAAVVVGLYVRALLFAAGVLA